MRYSYGGGTPVKDLKEYRKEIDGIDREIAELLEKRFDLVREIGRVKEKEGLPVADAARESEKINAIECFCKSNTAPYVAEVLKEIMSQSRRIQESDRKEYGLLGRKLGHSYSPQVHKLIGGYEFGLFEREPEELDAFFDEGDFRGITVTMPYKKEVIRYCDELSDTAAKCGSVNTVIKRHDGTIFGDNTDYYGFRSTVESSGIDVRGSKTVILGSGGVSGTVVRVMEDLGADPIVVISRKGENNYENLVQHSDAEIIVNATPVGMYPNAGESLIDIKNFLKCRAVFDLVYNPLRTKLMLDARDAGIPAFSGMHMLVAQAAKASGLFLGEDFDFAAKTQMAEESIRADVQNIVLIGMPGCGKTTIGRMLSERMGKPFADCDQMIEELYGRSPEDIIRERGIDDFRDIETSVIMQVMRRSPQSDGRTPGIIFSTGGGCVERNENKVPLLENSAVVYIRRPVAELDASGRPLTQKTGAQALFERRNHLYEEWSDFAVDSSEHSADEILQIIIERNSK